MVRLACHSRSARLKDEGLSSTNRSSARRPNSKYGATRPTRQMRGITEMFLRFAARLTLSSRLFSGRLAFISLSPPGSVDLPPGEQNRGPLPEPIRPQRRTGEVGRNYADGIQPELVANVDRTGEVFRLADHRYPRRMKD